MAVGRGGMQMRKIKNHPVYILEGHHLYQSLQMRINITRCKLSTILTPQIFLIWSRIASRDM